MLLFWSAKGGGVFSDLGLVVVGVPGLFLLVVGERHIRRCLEEVFPELRGRLLARTYISLPQSACKPSNPPRLPQILWRIGRQSEG